jgi:hypothetical protein
MKKLLLLVALSLGLQQLFSQQKDIPLSTLPSDVKDVLNEYLNILITSQDLDEAAERFLTIAGGGLVNPDGTSLRSSVKPFSLKKDFENVHFYKVPAKIERIAKTKTGQAGFGESAIAGDWYKIYIAKANGGQSAPVHIVLPKNHPTIKTPKVIQIGSF